MIRHNNFDALRLIGALLVLFSHQFALCGRAEPLFVGAHSYGNLGVLMFFSISGYLVSASWERDPALWRFLTKRFLRIAPALAVSIPITVILVYSIGLWKFPDNALHALNGSLWTIPLEVYCYLILAALSLLSMTYAPLLFALTVLVAHQVGFTDRSLMFVAYFGLFFAMGGLFYRYPRLLRWSPLLIVVGIGMIFAKHDTSLGLALIVPAVVIAIGTRSWPLLRHAGRFGDLSYGIYIYAWPIQQIVVALWPKDARYFELLLPSLAVTTALAVLSWHLVEKQALTLKPRGLSASGTGGRVEVATEG